MSSDSSSATGAPMDAPAQSPAPQAAAHDWTRKRERSSLTAMRVMRFIALAFGRRATRLVLQPIALWYALFDADVRGHSKRYLSRALGRVATWRDVHRHVHTFLATVLDRVYLLQERFDAFAVDAIGIDAILGPFRRGEGVLACGAHFGSFEALRMVGHDHGLRVAMIMYEDNARLINETLAALAPAPAAKAGDPSPAPVLHTIALGRVDAMITLRRWLDSGGVAGMLGDRSLPGAATRSKQVVVDFLGAPAPFPDGPFRLAALLRRKVVFMAGIYRGGNRYEMRFADIADFSAPAAALPQTAAARDAAVHEAVVGYARTLEALCREAPYNWFNFFDFWGEGDARR